MKKYSILFLLISALCSCTPKECQIAGGNYEFVLTATLSPAKDTFAIGDTIIIRSEFSNMIFDQVTEETYFLDNILFFPNSSILRIDTFDQIDDFSEFEIIIDNTFDLDFFNFSDGGRHLTGQYNYNSNNYSLQYRLVPKEKGLYIFNLSSSINNLGNDQTFDGKCSNVEMDAVVNLNNGADNNIDFLKDSPIERYNNWILIKPEERFHRFGGYCFYVE